MSKSIDKPFVIIQSYDRDIKMTESEGENENHRQSI